MKNDLIRRQEAIDAILSLTNCDTVEGLRAYVIEHDLGSWWSGGVLSSIGKVERLPSAEPEIIRCKDCKYFHYDKPYVVFGVPVLGHEVCDKWGDGCKTSEYGFCFLAERRGDKE